MKKRGRTLKKTRTDIEKHTVGRTDGRTDARNFVHRGRRVFFGDDPLFWFPFQSRVPLGGHFNFGRPRNQNKIASRSFGGAAGASSHYRYVDAFHWYVEQQS